MTQDEFNNLKLGDIVQHKSDGDGYVIHNDFGSRKTAVRVVGLTNPREWDLKFKANHRG